MPFIVVHRIPISFQLRRSVRSKRLHIISRAQAFEVVAPPKIKNIDILQFIFQQQGWMIRQFQSKNLAQPNSFQWPQEFLPNEDILFRDNKLKLQLKYNSFFGIQQQENALIVTLAHQKLKCDEVSIRVKKMVMQWYKEQAKALIEKSIQSFCPRLQRWPTSYRVKTQKTRWGSCGIQNDININWLLVLAPVGVLEYVVAHELCHLFHRNHGKRFWAKVAFCFPEYLPYKQWLSRQGHQLQVI